MLAISICSLAYAFIPGGKNILSMFYFNRNISSVLLVSIFPIVTGRDFFTSIESRQKTILKAIFITLVIYLVVLFRCRSALVILVFQILVTTFYVKLKQLLSMAATVLIGLTILFSFETNLRWNETVPIEERVQSFFSLEKSSGRAELWSVGFELFKENPLFGVGINQFGTKLRSYLYREQDQHLLKTIRFAVTDSNMFNDFFEIFVELGLIGGIILFILLFTRVFKIILCDFSSIYSLVAASILINSIFDYSLQRIHTLIIFVFALAMILKDNKKISKKSSKKLNYNFYALLIVSFVWGAVTISYTLRQFPTLSNFAYSAWKYDRDWNHLHFRTTEDNFSDQKIAFLTKVLSDRESLWPKDPNNFFIKGEVSRLKMEIELYAKNFYLATFDSIGMFCNGFNANIYSYEIQITEYEQLFLPLDHCF